MVIDNKFEIGDLVYLITDEDQYRRLITGFKVRINNIIYLLAIGGNEPEHYDFEISSEINMEMKVK